MSGEILWLASYPKSGNTWLRAVLSAWQTREAPRLNSLAAEGVAARMLFDDALGLPSSDLTPAEIEILRPRVDELLAGEAQGPLLRKIHDGLYLGPEGEPVVSSAATRAAVYMVRDPRDVAVSRAHHNARPVEWVVDQLEDPAAAMGDTTRALIPQLQQRLGTWSQHVRSWVDHAPFPVHVVRYEDCLADPLRAFGSALRFAGLGPVMDADVAQAVAHAAFDRLRDAEATHGFRERPAELERFFRSGRAGSWREEMPVAVARRVEAAHGEMMARFGYL